LIFGGIGAAGTAAVGTSAVVNAVNNVKAQNVTQSEAERHNRVLEEQTSAALKSGTGILSDLAGKVSVFGATLKYALQKLSFGIDDSIKIKKGESVCLGKGLYIAPVGNGLFLGPKSGNGLFVCLNPG